MISRSTCDAPADLGARRPGKTHKPGMGGVERDATGVSSASSNRESKDELEEALISPSDLTQSLLSCRLASFRPLEG